MLDTVSADGFPVNGQKGHWLKGAYHETELARFCHVYLSVLEERPVMLYYRYDGRVDPYEYHSVPARAPGLQWDVVDSSIIIGSTLAVRYQPRWEPLANRGDPR